MENRECPFCGKTHKIQKFYIEENAKLNKVNNFQLIWCNDLNDFTIIKVEKELKFHLEFCEN